MRLTQYLRQQHIGRMIQRHWYVAGKRKMQHYYNWPQIQELGIKITDPPTINLRKPLENMVLPLESRIPDYRIKLPKQEKICYNLTNDSLFIQGLPQAQLLLKTIIVEEKLPDKINKLIADIPEDIDNQVERIVETSTIFNSYQDKLPHRKHPEKLMWIYARDYGISSDRKTHNLCYKFLNLCEMISDNEISKNRSVILQGMCVVQLERNSDRIKFQLPMNIMVTSNKALTPICNKKDHSDNELPDLYPSHPLIGFEEIDKYEIEDIYPFKSSYSKYHVNTIIDYLRTSNLRNITEQPVRDDQILARSLIKSFTCAASYAKQKFGMNVVDLPEPITIQCIQCDGQNFHFSVFQLNTLNLNDTDGLKNYWWSQPKMPLYTSSGYEIGKPILEGYNPEVFKTMLAFYKNE